jgi:hypothetical protein
LVVIAGGEQGTLALGLDRVTSAAEEALALMDQPR